MSFGPCTNRSFLGFSIVVSYFQHSYMFQLLIFNLFCTQNTVPPNVNGKKLAHTSSCSSLESTYSSSSASYAPKPSATNSVST